MVMISHGTFSPNSFDRTGWLKSMTRLISTFLSSESELKWRLGYWTQNGESYCTHFSFDWKILGRYCTVVRGYITSVSTTNNYLHPFPLKSLKRASRQCTIAQDQLEPLIWDLFQVTTPPQMTETLWLVQGYPLWENRLSLTFRTTISFVQHTIYNDGENPPCNYIDTCSNMTHYFSFD